MRTNLNRYQIEFETPDGSRRFVIGVANNVPFAIQNALRAASRAGHDVSGLKYVSHVLVDRGW